MFKYFVYIIPVILLILIILMPVSIRLRYSRRSSDDHFMVYYCPFHNITMFKLEIPIVQLRFQGLEPYLKLFGELEGISPKPVVKSEVKVKTPPWYKLPKILNLTPEYIVAGTKLVTINKDLLNRVACLKLQWETDFGFKDASITGITAGTLWAAKSLLVKQISRSIKMGHRVIKFNVTPNYAKPGLSVDFDCILRVRLGYIIIAGVRVLKLIMSLIITSQTKGVSVWQRITQLNH